VVSTPSATRFNYFAVTTPGLESLLRREVQGMGIEAIPVLGGVEGKITACELWDLHLKSALAESVRVRLKPFYALDFGTLEQGLGRLPWHAYLGPGRAFELKVTCHKSKLFHSDAVAERAFRVIRRKLGLPPVAPVFKAAASLAGSEAPPSDSTSAVQQIFLRLLRDDVITSVDASGELLHRRGYRTRVEQAPLRETLAAAMVRLLNELYPPGVRRMCDPFAGSGVLPLEWLESRTTNLPGARRGFAFEQWPIHAAEAWRQHRAQRIEAARETTTGHTFHAVGSDIDAKAVSSAQGNALAAGHQGSSEFTVADFRDALLRESHGTAVLTNPPYGVRIGDRHRARSTYLELDEVLVQRRDLRPVVITCVDKGFLARAALPWRVLVETHQGGLPLMLLGLGRD
jgi:putative N6-adenine-specific DNA methylase